MNKLEQNKALAEQAMYLAYLASHQVGMGFLFGDRVLTKEEVVKLTAIPTAIHGLTHKYQLDADYIGGRMMKTTIEYDDGGVLVNHGRTPSPSYQSWVTTYPTGEDLLEAARSAV